MTISSKEKTEMHSINFPTPDGGWDIAALTALFASDPDELGDVDVDVENEVLFITIKEKGDLVVSMTPSGDQVLASVLLIEENEVPNANAFNKAALTLHKAIPLSTFGLTTVGDGTWYELFGSLSVRCGADDLVEEVAVLATNAAEAAEWITEWKEKYDPFREDRKGEQA